MNLNIIELVELAKSDTDLTRYDTIYNGVVRLWELDRVDEIVQMGELLLDSDRGLIRTFLIATKPIRKDTRISQIFDVLRGELKRKV